MTTIDQTTDVPRAKRDIREITGIDLVIDEWGGVVILHTKPFEEDLTWLEFDLDNRTLNFVFDEGKIRDLGFSVNQDVTAYMQNAHIAKVALVEGEDVVADETVPLLVHRA